MVADGWAGAVLQKNTRTNSTQTNLEPAKKRQKER